jgi:hypothetical protein
MSMIQLTPQQVEAVAAGAGVPPTLIDPNTQTAYVLVRKDLYEQLLAEEYDDSPWTPEERDMLAWEAGKHAGWEDMDDYDDKAQIP